MVHNIRLLILNKIQHQMTVFTECPNKNAEPLCFFKLPTIDANLQHVKVSVTLSRQEEDEVPG